MIPKKLKARYSIDICGKLYEEIRIDETWDEKGRPSNQDRAEDGFLWSELFIRSNETPFDKAAWNYRIPVQGGSGRPESFFENFFSEENIRRKGLELLYPDEYSDLKQKDYWKKDPRISWLYYKRCFDAVFPVMCETGLAQLKMEIVGELEDGRKCSCDYATDKDGELWAGGKRLYNISFFDERYLYREKPEELEAGKPEKIGKGKETVMLYGVHSLTDLFEGLEMAAKEK